MIHYIILLVLILIAIYLLYIIKNYEGFDIFVPLNDISQNLYDFIVPLNDIIKISDISKNILYDNSYDFIDQSLNILYDISHNYYPTDLLNINDTVDNIVIDKQKYKISQIDYNKYYDKYQVSINDLTNKTNAYNSNINRFYDNSDNYILGNKRDINNKLNKIINYDNNHNLEDTDPNIIYNKFNNYYNYFISITDSVYKYIQTAFNKNTSYSRGNVINNTTNNDIDTQYTKLKNIINDINSINSNNLKKNNISRIISVTNSITNKTNQYTLNDDIYNNISTINYYINQNTDTDTDIIKIFNDKYRIITIIPSSFNYYLIDNIKKIYNNITRSYNSTNSSLKSHYDNKFYIYISNINSYVNNFDISINKINGYNDISMNEKINKISDNNNNYITTLNTNKFDYTIFSKNIIEYTDINLNSTINSSINSTLDSIMNNSSDYISMSQKLYNITINSTDINDLSNNIYNSKTNSKLDELYNTIYNDIIINGYIYEEVYQNRSSYNDVSNNLNAYKDVSNNLNAYKDVSNNLISYNEVNSKLIIYNDVSNNLNAYNEVNSKLIIYNDVSNNLNINNISPYYKNARNNLKKSTNPNYKTILSNLNNPNYKTILSNLNNSTNPNYKTILSNLNNSTNPNYKTILSNLTNPNYKTILTNLNTQIYKKILTNINMVLNYLFIAVSFYNIYKYYTTMFNEYKKYITNNSLSIKNRLLSIIEFNNSKINLSEYLNEINTYKNINDLQNYYNSTFYNYIIPKIIKETYLQAFNNYIKVIYDYIYDNFKNNMYNTIQVSYTLYKTAITTLETDTNNYNSHKKKLDDMKNKLKKDDFQLEKNISDSIEYAVQVNRKHDEDVLKEKEAQSEDRLINMIKEYTDKLNESKINTFEFINNGNKLLEKEQQLFNGGNGTDIPLNHFLNNNSFVLSKTINRYIDPSSNQPNSYLYCNGDIDCVDIFGDPIQGQLTDLSDKYSAYTKGKTYGNCGTYTDRIELSTYQRKLTSGLLNPGNIVYQYDPVKCSTDKPWRVGGENTIKDFYKCYENSDIASGEAALKYNMDDTCIYNNSLIYIDVDYINNNFQGLNLNPFLQKWIGETLVYKGILKSINKNNLLDIIIPDKDGTLLTDIQPQYVKIPNLNINKSNDFSKQPSGTYPRPVCKGGTFNQAIGDNPPSKFNTTVEIPTYGSSLLNNTSDSIVSSEKVTCSNSGTLNYSSYP
jgi:hypothetical protein